MKKYIILFLLLFLCINTHAQNGVFLFNDQRDTICINSDKILSISHDNTEENQIITCKDTVYTIPTASVDSVVFVKLDDCIKVYDKDRNSETYVRKDGAFLNVFYNESEEPLSLQMMLPDELSGVLFINTEFDKYQRPTTISINENAISLDWIDENHCDVTYVFADSIAYKIENQEVDFQTFSNHALYSPGFGQTWQKKLGGTLQMVGGAVSIVGGTILIAGSGAAEFFTVGGSTPISIPGIIAGSAAVAGGISSMHTGYITLFHPELADDYKNNWQSTIYFQTVGEVVVPRATQLMPTKYFPYFIESKTKSLGLDITGWSGFFITLSGDLIGVYGKKYNWYDHYKHIMDDTDYKKIVTGLVKDITSHSATIRGYVSNEIQKSEFDGTRFNTEYGIILRSVKDKTDVQVFTISNGEGGAFEHVFENLNPDEEYSYVTYFYDRSNDIIRLGDVKNFKTKVAPIVNVTLYDFEVTKSQYKEGAFSNNGYTYDFRFDAKVTAEIFANNMEYVKEWGYVYEDPNGKCVKIPLSGSKYTDSRYAYFRNSAHSTARLYGYAYIEESENPVYYKIHDFPLDHIMAVANTGEYENVSANSATVACSFDNIPDGATCGVEYSENDNWSRQTASSKEGTQKVTLRGLKPGTKYYYRAFIDDGGQMYYGGHREFTTNVDLPDLTGTWSCTIYKDDGSVLDQCTFYFTDDHKVTQKDSDWIKEGEIGSWSLNTSGKVGVSFSWAGGSQYNPTWYGETYSGQVNNMSNPSSIEGKVSRAWVGISEHGNTYQFKMTR